MECVSKDTMYAEQLCENRHLFEGQISGFDEQHKQQLLIITIQTH